MSLSCASSNSNQKVYKLIDYIYIINRYGPIVHLWSMRFEGKHKEFKTAARGNYFKNILKTRALYHQRNLAYNLT